MKSKFISIFIALVILCNSCQENFKYYEGYIYSRYRKPLQGLRVEKKYYKDDFAITDSLGYFRIKEKKNSGSGFLMVSTKQEILIDSIQVVRKAGGEQVNFYFVEGRNDTLFIDFK